jgi:LysM repeat protein
MNALAQLQAKEPDARLSGATQALINEANACVAFDDNSLAACIDLAGRIQRQASLAEKERKAMVKPFNDGVKAINERFKRITEPLSIAQGIVKDSIRSYQIKREQELLAEARKRQEEERAALLAQAAAEEEVGNTVQAEVALRQAVQVRAEPEKVNVGKTTDTTSVIQKRWTFRVADIQALAAARPDLVQVDAVAIRREITAGARSVAGLEIFQESSITIRS